jgi:hypothetical protein
MSDTINITLAGTEYTVPRMNLRQLRDLSVGIARDAQAAPSALPDRIELAFDSEVNIVETAFRRVRPEMTAAAIYELETTKDEISRVAVTVLRFAGLIPDAGENAAPVVPTA